MKLESAVKAATLIGNLADCESNLNLINEHGLLLFEFNDILDIMPNETIDIMKKMIKDELEDQIARIKKEIKEVK